MWIRVVAMVLTVMACIAQTAWAKEEVPRELIQGTIESAESLVFPHKNVKVSYNGQDRSVYVKFTTPRDYKVVWADYWLRWRDNQWVVLQEFKQADISVSKITVETNHHDGSAQVRVITEAKFVDKYAKKADPELWRRVTTIYQKGKDLKWTKIRR